MKIIRCGEIRKIFFKPFAGIHKSGGGGKPRARADNYGVRLVKRGLQAFDLLRAVGRRFACPYP